MKIYLYILKFKFKKKRFIGVLFVGEGILVLSDIDSVSKIGTVSQACD